MSAIIVQLGSRMRYAVPRILQSAGQLARFHTDIAGDRGWPQGLRMLPVPARFGPVRRLLGRRIEGIPPDKVRAHAWLGVKVVLRERSARHPEELARAHIRNGHELCHLALRDGWRGATVAGAIGTSSEPLLAAAKRDGLSTFKEQIIAPPSVERRILKAERAAYPGWETDTDQTGWYGLFEEVAVREWALADLIVCGSEFVRQGVREAGGPFDRCVVVPYGVSLPPQIRRQVGERADRPLRVLTVGTIGLRKGAPHVAAAARVLGGRAEFRWAGHLALSPEGGAKVAASVELLGHVPRDEILRQFAWADVFLLPSLCEGSATVCYEALACGLPVITTASAGTVIRDGIEGWLVPAGESTGIVRRVEQFADDRALLAVMAAAAHARAEEFTLERYGQRLLTALTPLLQGRRTPAQP